MNGSTFGWLAVAAVLASGCSQKDNRADEDLSESLKRVERISYYDSNGDGKVDVESHQYVGANDADWELRDEDHNGRFEKKIRYGVGVFESAVDLPVPKGVRIDPKP